MTPSHSTREGTIRYRYCVCSSAQKKGWHCCPFKSVSIRRIETLPVGQIRELVLPVWNAPTSKEQGPVKQRLVPIDHVVHGVACGAMQALGDPH